MARLSDIIQTGIRKEDLHDEEGNDPPEWVEKLIRIVNTGLRSTYNVLTPGVSQGGISFGDNFKCNLVTAKFTHGVATSLSLGTLTSAKGCLVLGADKGGVVLANKLTGSTQTGQVKLTLWFADPTVTNANVTVLLLPEGTLGTQAGSVPQAWQTPTLLNSYTAARPVSFYMDPFSMVHLRGTVTGGTADTIFTLPSGYAPKQAYFESTDHNGAYGRIQVDTAGNVLSDVGGHTNVVLDGVSFDTR